MRVSAVLVLGACLLSAAVAQGQATAEAPSEPAAAGLARDLIGPPEGERLSGAELDRLTEAVSSLMRCPVCQGLSVADSPTTSALAMREEARDLLASGYTEEQVLSYFERSYGEFIRLSPKPEGFNLVVWILPVAALLAGFLLVAGRLLRRRKIGSVAAAASRRAETATEPEPASAGNETADELAAYAERVRREVSR